MPARLTVHHVPSAGSQRPAQAVLLHTQQEGSGSQCGFCISRRHSCCLVPCIHEEDVAQMQDGSHCSEDGILLRLWKSHERHGASGALQGNNHIQMALVRTER